MRVSRLVINLRSSLWFVPVLCVLLGSVLSFATIALDRAFDYEAIPSSLVGGPDAATAILSTVAASMVSLGALVLTITMVVVQLAMGQFSPRIVQRILQDKPSARRSGVGAAGSPVVPRSCSHFGRQFAEGTQTIGHGVVRKEA